MSYIKAQITRKDAERYRPKKAPYGAGPVWEKGEHIGYNAGLYGWNWDLIEYQGQYYVAGYRSFPKTFEDSEEE